MAKFTFGKFGLKENPVGAQVSMEFNSRTLLGDVKGCYRSEILGCTKLIVHHFNGKPWPINPSAVAVDILERTYEPEQDATSVAPFADLPQSAKRDAALGRWAKS